MQIRGPRSLERVVRWTWRRITSKQRVQLNEDWCVECQTLSVICRLNFVHPTEVTEPQVQEKSKVSKRYVSTLKARPPTSNVRSFFYSYLFSSKPMLNTSFFDSELDNCAGNLKSPNLNRPLRLLEQWTSCPSTRNCKHSYRNSEHEQST